MAKYYAYDMPNGKTYIGTPDFDSLETSILLKETLVVDTISCELARLSSLGIVNRIYFKPVAEYTNAYLDSKAEYHLADCLIPKNGIGSAIASWYLGEDIRSNKNK